MGVVWGLKRDGVWFRERCGLGRGGVWFRERWGVV